MTMSSSLSEEDNKTKSKCLLTLKDFELLAVVGEGAYGKVNNINKEKN